MDCTQDNDLMTFLIELGILPCLGILLLLFGLFIIFIKCLSHDKPEEYSDDEAVAILFSIVFMLIISAFLVGSILNNLLISVLTRKPLHWF